MLHTTPTFSSPNIADVSEEMRDRAFKRTTEMLRKFDEIRRSMDLPMEHLPIVIDTYGKVVLALLAENEREEVIKSAKRLPLTMRSETSDYQPMKVRPGVNNSVPVCIRPHAPSFRPEDLAIHGDRARWRVHDLKVGNRSQFTDRRGPAAGTEFGPGGILEHLRLDTLYAGMDITIVVEYIGPEPDGEVFEATMVGTAFDR